MVFVWGLLKNLVLVGLLRALITLFFIIEDRYLRNHVIQICRNCIVSKVEIERRGSGVRLHIYAAQVRTLVGPERKTLNKLRYSLQDRCQRLRQKYFWGFGTIKTSIEASKKVRIQVSVCHVICPEADAACLADFILIELGKRTPFRRILRMCQERAQRFGQVLGLRLQISGRLNGAEIARTEWVRRGRVPLHTLSADLDYSFKVARTIYGSLGVKVLVYRSNLIIFFLSKKD